MKRILIVYDTKGGPPARSSAGSRRGPFHEAQPWDAFEATRAATVPLNYDLIVAGTPIYYDHPMDSVLRFLGRDDLRGHSLALFVVCYAGVFGMRNFMVRRYLDELQHLCKGHTIYETSFDAAQGPWRKLNKEVCIDFGRMLAGQIHRPPEVVETA